MPNANSCTFNPKCCSQAKRGQNEKNGDRPLWAVGSGVPGRHKSLNEGKMQVVRLIDCQGFSAADCRVFRSPKFMLSENS